MDKDFVLVVGGTRGIGAAIALAAARENADVLIAGRNSEKGDTVARECKAAGASQAEFHHCDVAVDADVEALFAWAAEEFKRPPNYVVACSGTGGPSHKPFHELDAAELRRVIDVNFTGAAQVARLGWRYMRAGGTTTTSRSIVLISSIGSAFNRAHARFIPVYSPTKAALDQLTRALALTAAEDGIRIYTCNPGVTDTDMGRGVSQSQFPHETLEEFARHYNPDGHAASADDVGAAVWRLLKGAARVQTSLSADPGEAVAAQPGDALACFAGGALLNMAALYASMAGDDADAVAPWRTKAST